MVRYAPARASCTPRRDRVSIQAICARLVCSLSRSLFNTMAILSRSTNVFSTIFLPRSLVSSLHLPCDGKFEYV